MQRPQLRPCPPDADADTGGDGAGPGILRERAHPPALKINDPAVRAMLDFRREPAPTLPAELTLEQALDRMFRMGVRVSLVLRAGLVAGVVTAEAVRAVRTPPTVGAARTHAGGSALRVEHAMTPADEVPAIDWQVIEEGQVRDLVEIIEGSGAAHLLVLENAAPTLIHVRGLVQRERLERQLGARGWLHASSAQVVDG